jgi:hypothetical protein
MCLSTPVPILISTCTTRSDPVVVYEGLFIEKTITGLTPFTVYEFQVISVNDVGMSDYPVWIRVETKTDRKTFLCYNSFIPNICVNDMSDSLKLSLVLFIEMFCRHVLTEFSYCLYPLCDQVRSDQPLHPCSPIKTFTLSF